MNLTNEELEILQKIEIELWNKGSDKYFALWRLIESKLNQKEERNKNNWKRIKEKRKVNKNYARSKKEIERRKNK